MPGIRLWAALLLTVAASAALSPSPVLVLTPGAASPRCLGAGSPPGFELAFKHSMYPGWVHERYRLDGGHLRRVAFVADSAAAAEYYGAYGNIARVADGYAVTAPELTVDRLVVRVDAVGRHRLTAGGEAIDLVAGFGEGRVTLTGETVPLAVRLVWCRG